METRSAHPSRRRVFAAMLVAPLALAACGGGDDGDNAASAPPTSAGASPTAASSSSTSPTTEAIVATTTSPTTTPPATTTPATTPATTEPCGSQCPLADDQQAAVDEFFAAYNGDDWEAFRNILVEEEVSWEFTPVIAQNEELMRYDFVWSAGLDEMWTPERCFDQYGVISCQVVIEDDLHRALAPFGFPASRCSISMELADGRLRPLRYDALFGCFGAYDVAMHQYGGWFEEQYPDLEPIQGVHYRAWNQTDETAPARAAEHLDEWIELVIQPIVDEGGDIMSFEG